jgi:hypothetical protein
MIDRLLLGGLITNFVSGVAGFAENFNFLPDLLLGDELAPFVDRSSSAYYVGQAAILLVPAPKLELGPARPGYGVNDSPVRIEGVWSTQDMKQGLLGHPPRGLGSPDLHHADQMPGSAVHEILPLEHRNNPELHPNRFNQGVTPEMRMQDRQLHWWYRAREAGADAILPGWIYD